MIHPSAQISREARVDPSTEIGAFVVIDGPVKIGPRNRLKPHVYICGWTEIGSDNIFYPGAVIGEAPQDLRYGGEESYLRIGSGNTFREHSQVHRGSEPGSATIIGNGNYVMQNAHIAHNCKVADRVILGGGALLAGHVQVGEQAFVSGNCVVHQFVRIGRLALLRGLSRTSRDVPPFCIMDGTHTVRGVNVIGLRRAGIDAERIAAIQRAVRKIFGRRTNVSRALEELAREEITQEVAELIDFIASSKRGVCVGPPFGRLRPARSEEGDAD